MVKNKFKNILFIFVVLGLIIITPFISFAENEIQVTEGEINVETSPASPRPYQDVLITLSSYATDLNRAIITWQTESGTALSGIGKTSYTIKTKGVDSYTVVNITINPVGSLSTINKRVVITPTEVEMVWESLSGYTPPFYKGKALPISGGLVKVMAIPNTSMVSSGIGSLTYTWMNNKDTKLDSSGYNKNYFIYRNSMFEDKNDISVAISSVGGSFNAEETITIPNHQPKLIFYKKSPTEGILYNQALENEVYMEEDEMTIIAEPYYTSLREEENNFSFSWQINEEGIPTPTKKTELTIRPNSRGGYAMISLTIENINSLFQKVSNQLRINI